MAIKNKNILITKFFVLILFFTTGGLYKITGLSSFINQKLLIQELQIALSHVKKDL